MSPALGKQQLPMHQQLHHTLHHPQHHPQQQQPQPHLAQQQQQPQPQPLVGANSQPPTMLQFHHQTLHHPYSTLHQQQHQSLNHPNQHQNGLHTLHFSSSSSSNNSNASQNLTSHLHSQQQHQQPHQQLQQQHHQQQHQQQQHHNLQQQQQQQQQHHHNQQYNMNSDYSSSTYHIYDQISDLIIIKQQRMERKRQLERRRKVILLTLAATILVGTLLFLVLQSMMSQSSSASSVTSNLIIARDDPSGQSVVTSINQPNNQLEVDPALSGRPATWAPSGGSKPTDSFDPSMMSQAGGANSQFPSKPVLPFGFAKTPSELCSGHGTVISLAGLDSAPGLQCKCDVGYWGEHCEFSAVQQPPPSQSQLARCLLSNCNGNGHCNYLGRCLCQPGFLGPNCEFRLAPGLAGAMVPVNSNSPMSHQQPSPTSLMDAPETSQPVNLPPTAVHRCAIALNNCNGNGQCVAPGRCRCSAGFTGDACLERDLCYERTCSGQGTCQPSTGICMCKPGYSGAQCESRDDQMWQRLLNCSNHGKFDFILRKCNCDRGFTGIDCSDESCDLGANGQQPKDCGSNGLYDCRQNKCICQDGFSGDLCQVQECSAQCLRNGQCLDGVCVCQTGFYGRHCSLNGCPNQCSGRGQCSRVADQVQQQQQQQQPQVAEWKCQCQAGATGDDCSVLMERQCDDGIDNDRDGLVDCADSECCSDKVCQNSTLCMKSPDPLDILMRKQPPPPTSSFYQRMQFLIEKSSSQIYSNPKEFNDSRASVIRGRVTYLRQGVTGVRVSVAGQLSLGITLTRDGGYFDLMVNGGGAVALEFFREPFATLQRAVRVPWNEIVLMDAVELALLSADSIPTGSRLAEQADEDTDAPSCSVHNYRLMRPSVVAAPKSTRHSHSSARIGKLGSGQSAAGGNSRAVILRESALVQQSILLPGSSSRADTNDPTSANQSVSLVYISSRANEFMSTINIQLTPPADQQFKLPAELKLIHLKIVIEGNLFEQLFEPQANLSFTWAWNRRNVYRQKSFGLSSATVSVGYEYFDCKHTVWTSKQIQLPGHDLAISDIGSQWNLNIHHRYNYRDAILQRGDGQNFNLKTDKQRVVQPVMGDGYQRQAICPFCDGASSPTEQRLLKPQALVAAPDGSLYVGDFNLIRRVEWAPSTTASSASERVVRTILELPTTRVPSKYGLALSPTDNKLYMTDVDRHQIYHVRQQQQPAEPSSGSSSSNDSQGAAGQTGQEDNLIPVVGSGARCMPADERSNCGDGQAARTARLVEPKAIAFDLSSRMYIADGPNVRMVDKDGRIYTILGDYGVSRHTKFPCTGEAIPMHKFVPRAPQDVAVNPLDDTLHILDDNVVYKVTQDKRVQIVAGRLAHCLAGESGPSSAGKRLRATDVFLQSAQTIVFSQNGDLFVSEDDPKQFISRVLLVSTNENSIQLFAGLPIDRETSMGQKSTGVAQAPTVDSVHLDAEADLLQQATDSDKQRSSNVLALGGQATRATDYKFSSIAAIAVDQQGRLLVADRLQLRVLSVEPDLPQVNAAGEYELQSPDNSDELLVFNRHGHHVATREISSGLAQRNSNKYTFTYNVNTSFGQLASVAFANGNKISIYRDGPHHSVKMIETAFGGQCKLEVTRSGQVHSISTVAPNASKTSFSYQVDGGLLKQSRDQASGEMFEFSYDEFGRALAIVHSSPRLPAALECRVGASASERGYIGQHCASLLVAN